MKRKPFDVPLLTKEFIKLQQSIKQQKIPVTPKPKKRLFIYTDSPLVSTGFGTVARYITKALHNTGDYEIEQLAINHFIDEPEARRRWPISLVAAQYYQPNDPYGRQKCIDMIKNNNYDIILMINDLHILQDISNAYHKLIKIKRDLGHNNFYTVVYFPVDCTVRPEYSGILKVADVNVAYTSFGKQEAEKKGYQVHNVIYHGTDTKIFFPLQQDEIKALRERWFGLKDNDFLWINVNRNTQRKNIAQTIYAFNEFRKIVPNSKLYLHCNPVDNSNNIQMDIRPCINHLGLTNTDSIIFPANFNQAVGVSTDMLNKIYNCGNAFITTNLGEGYGLVIQDSLAVGVPVVCPDNTVHSELFGQGKGYLYACREPTYIDLSGYRMAGRIDDIVEQMLICYNDWLNKSARRASIIQNGLNFVRNNTWDDVGKQWINLIGSLKCPRKYPIAASEDV